MLPRGEKARQPGGTLAPPKIPRNREAFFADADVQEMSRPVDNQQEEV
jgi:hypothetical protein